MCLLIHSLGHRKFVAVAKFFNFRIFNCSAFHLACWHVHFEEGGRNGSPNGGRCPYLGNFEIEIY